MRKRRFSNTRYRIPTGGRPFTNCDCQSWVYGFSRYGKALCIPDDARAGRMMFAKFDPDNIPERINCGPMKLGKCYVADVKGMDPYKEITGYTNDVLIVHGTKDSIVKPSYSEKAYNTYLQNTAESNKVVIKFIDGGTHGFLKKHDAIAIEELRRFI